VPPVVPLLLTATRNRGPSSCRASWAPSLMPVSVRTFSRLRATTSRSTSPVCSLTSVTSALVTPPPVSIARVPPTAPASTMSAVTAVVTRPASIAPVPPLARSSTTSAVTAVTTCPAWTVLMFPTAPAPTTSAVSAVATVSRASIAVSNPLAAPSTTSVTFALATTLSARTALTSPTVAVSTTSAASAAVTVPLASRLSALTTPRRRRPLSPAPCAPFASR